MATETTTNPAKIWLAWAFVGIPLLWGMVTTIGNALALFQ
ncbi:MFS transporter small subunit [Mangrovibrevibacter kandeliae]